MRANAEYSIALGVVIFSGMPSESAEIRKLFASFGARMLALGIDCMVIIFLAAAINDHLLASAGLRAADNRSIVLVLFVTYFAVSWASPLRATPGQLLFGMRVVDLAGNALRFPRALLRSIAVTALIAAAYVSIVRPSEAWPLAISIAAYAAVFLAAVTPNRQAAHDFLAGTVVVHRRSLADGQRREQLLSHIAEIDPATYRARKPHALRMLRDAVILAVPALTLVSAAQVMEDRELLVRTYYAYNAVAALRSAVEAHYAAHREWPDSAQQLGLPVRESYPDGGYYELEDDGVIRIHFEVLPELREGTIIVSPGAAGDEIEWRCHAEGNIRQHHLPMVCRD